MRTHAMSTWLLVPSKVLVFLGAIAALTSQGQGQTCGSNPFDPAPPDTSTDHFTYGKWIGPYVLYSPPFIGGVCSTPEQCCGTGTVCLWRDPCYADGAPANSFAHALLLPHGDKAGQVLFMNEIGAVAIWKEQTPQNLDTAIFCEPLTKGPSFQPNLPPGAGAPWGDCWFSIFC